MGRTKQLEPRIPLKVYLSEKALAQLKLASMSDYSGKSVYGLQSQIVEDALSLYFATKRTTECTPPPPSPDSQPSDKSDNPAS